MTVNPKLLDLLERDELDWDDERHREAYLKAWVKDPGALPRYRDAPQGPAPGE